MKKLKNLLLSATTVFIAIGAVEQAQALWVDIIHNTSSVQQNDKQQAAPRQQFLPATHAAIVKEPSSQSLSILASALLKSSDNHALAQILHEPHSQDTLQLLIQKLGPVWGLNTDHQTEIEQLFTDVRIIRDQIAKFMRFKALNNQDINEPNDREVLPSKEGLTRLKYKLEEIRTMIENPQGYFNHFEEDEDLFSLAAAKLTTLEDKIERLNLKISHLDMRLSTLSLLQSARRAKEDEQLGASLNSSNFIDLSPQQGKEKTSTVDHILLDDTYDAIGSLATSSRSKEDYNDEEGVARLPTIPMVVSLSNENTHSSYTTPIHRANEGEDTYTTEMTPAEVFPKARPTHLGVMEEDEAVLWRTFLTLMPAHKEGNKQWSAWGGVYKDEVLATKFENHPFLSKAFATKKKLRDGLYISNNETDPLEEALISYFENPTAYDVLETEEGTDLIKARYFRSLYQALTKLNTEEWNIQGSRIVDTKFNVNCETGVKGGFFQHGNRVMPIYEAETYYENTPWHPLFVQKAIQSTLNSLAHKLRKSTLSYKSLQMMKAFEETDKEVEISEEEFEQQYIMSVKAGKDIEAQIQSIYKVKSLQEIDDLLKIE